MDWVFNGKWISFYFQYSRHSYYRFISTHEWGPKGLNQEFKRCPVSLYMATIWLCVFLILENLCQYAYTCRKQLYLIFIKFSSQYVCCYVIDCRDKIMRLNLLPVVIMFLQVLAIHL